MRKSKAFSTLCEWLVIIFFVAAVLAGVTQVMKYIIPDPAMRVIVCHYNEDGNQIPVCKSAVEIIEATGSND